MKVEEMMGFPTKDKIPLFPWRNPKHRRSVEYLFERYDQVGIVPAEHGCVVIDLDKKNGVDGVKTFFAHFKHVPESMNYRTSSGGFHLWYKVPAGTVIPQATSKLPGVDIRYADGYACLGKGYKVLRDGEIADCPDPILDWLKRPKRKNDGVARSNDCNPLGTPNSRKFSYNVSPIPKGCRNDTLYRWGFGIVREVRDGSLSEKAFSELLHLRGGNSGMTYGEVEKIIESLLQVHA